MSVEIFYFEQNKPSNYYEGYKDVNVYNLPPEFESQIVSIYNLNSIVKVSVFGFGVASKLFDLSYWHLRNKLIEFIVHRLSNPCIQPVLLIAIEDNYQIDISKYHPSLLNINNLNDVFEEQVFNGLFYISN